MVREVAFCQICGSNRFLSIEGFDYKPGPEVFEFLGLSGRKSRWSICKSCGFLFQNPRAMPNKILEVYSSGLYRQNRRYDERFFRSRYVNPQIHVEWCMQHVQLDDDAKVLDIGAGVGGAVRAFLDRGYDAEGMEIDPNLCAQARTKFGVGLMESDIMTVDLPAESFDLVYSAHVHEHFDDWRPVNERIYQWLKPGGYLLIVVPTFWFTGMNGQGFINVFHNSMFTKTSLHNMFVNNGFSPVVVSYLRRKYITLKKTLSEDALYEYPPEVWGVARKIEGAPLPAIKQENPYLVRYGVHWSPPLIQPLYRLLSIGARLPYRLKKFFRDVRVLGDSP